MIKNHCRIFILIMYACCYFHASKTIAQVQKINGGSVIHFASSNTCFPETKRLNGYVYDSLFYDFNNHYRDSSVLMVVPDKLHVLHDSIDIIFWFHGWHNNIDTALSYYHLATQFIAAHKNAILVLTEAAKNAPDSYGGKLEQQNIFKGLVQDVIQNLQANKIILTSCKPGNIILAGHSGAYRVIAYMLQNGGVRIKEVDLFDALYSETNKFMQWLKEERGTRFINMYTNTGGGTDEVSIKMTDALKTQKISFLFAEENNLNDTLLMREGIYFIHSTRQHNDIIFNPDNFLLFLDSSPFLKTQGN
jgi:hypothetical protein